MQWYKSMIVAAAWVGHAHQMAEGRGSAESEAELNGVGTIRQVQEPFDGTRVRSGDAADVSRTEVGIESGPQRSVICFNDGGKK